MDASVQRCRLLAFWSICVMQCSSEQVQRTLASVMVATKYFLSPCNVLSHRSHSADVICKNVLEIRSNFAKFGKNSWPSCQLHY